MIFRGQLHDDQDSKVVNKQELLQKFQDILACVQDFIQLSVTGLPPDAGCLMKEKSAKFANNAHTWVQDKVSCFQDYPGLPTPEGFLPNKSKMLKTNLAKFK